MVVIIQDGRSYDHRQIAIPLDNIDHPVSQGGTEGMIEFMKLGPIRIDFNSGSIHIITPPTPKQYNMLKYFINETPSDEISLDLKSSNKQESYNLQSFDKRKAFGLIKKFYE